jgi:hypothetical protein
MNIIYYLCKSTKLKSFNGIAMLWGESSEWCFILKNIWIDFVLKESMPKGARRF